MDHDRKILKARHDEKEEGSTKESTKPLLKYCTVRLAEKYTTYRRVVSMGRLEVALVASVEFP